MRHLTLIAGLACFALMAGCSSARLKKCESRASDPKLQVCGDSVDSTNKLFRMCEKPRDLFLCEDPQ